MAKKTKRGTEIPVVQGPAEDIVPASSKDYRTPRPTAIELAAGPNLVCPYMADAMSLRMGNPVLCIGARCAKWNVATQSPGC